MSVFSKLLLFCNPLLPLLHSSMSKAFSTSLPKRLALAQSWLSFVMENHYQQKKKQLHQQLAHNTNTLNIYIYFSSTILFQGWGWDHQADSREGFGFLGITEPNWLARFLWTVVHRNKILKVLRHENHSGIWSNSLRGFGWTLYKAVKWWTRFLNGGWVVGETLAYSGFWKGFCRKHLLGLVLAKDSLPGLFQS